MSAPKKGYTSKDREKVHQQMKEERENPKKKKKKKEEEDPQMDS
jgi:hypothetical protein